MSILRATSAPARPTTAAQTLADVELLLAERLDLLAGEWQENVADPVLGVGDLPGLLRGLLLGGGKRFRPLMCHWGWAASGAAARGDDPAPMLQVGVALELLHAFGLAQDDVMDGSVLRRGRPAVHVSATRMHHEAGGHDDAARYGESVAVLVGDLAHAEADAAVAGLSPAVRRLWWRTCVELVRGQVHDLGAAALGGGPRALERAREVARAKSGAYSVQRPLELGATVAGAAPGVLAALGDYGCHLGEAFALRDDLLGVFGDPARTGKPADDDLRTGKATVLLALVEQRSTAAAAASVARVREQRHDEDDVALVRETMVTSGVRAEVEQRIDECVRAACVALDRGLLDGDAVDGLTELTRHVAWRSR